MSKAMDRMKHKTYARLDPMRKHKFGALKTWPKYKTLKKVFRVMELEEKGVPQEEWSEEEREVWNEGWNAIRWRPLVSYAGHRLRNLFRMLGQFCEAAVKTLNVGAASTSA